MSCYVIGDIHGCVDELRWLMDRLPLQAGDLVVFLGDYIDRGPDSKGVVSYLLDLQRCSVGKEFIFLKGNHEDMLLSYLGLEGQHGDMFLYNGGRSTLASYGLAGDEQSSEEALAAIPVNHLAFYQSLKRYYIVDSFLCVHAGIHPLKPLKAQTDSELFWIRGEFINNPHRLPYTVLFGHTPQKKVLYHLPYKLGLDTGLVYGNKLSCFETTKKILYQISRGKKTVRQTLVQEKWNQNFPSLIP
jgi:serine/threonine protein phosphatase 1